MILLTKLKKGIARLFLLLLVAQHCYGQDLYNAEHTRKYADHLFNTKQYESAANEYKRLQTFEPNNDSIAQKVLISYRLSGQSDSGIAFLRKRYTLPIDASEIIKEEYTRSLIMAERYSEADGFLWHNTLMDSNFRKTYYFYNNALSNNWVAARAAFNSGTLVVDKNTDAWSQLLVKQQKLKLKSPGLAMAMSVVFPGSGRVYTNDWKDGAISLLMVSSMAYESYVGFRARGTRSVLGWVFGGLAVGFYGGNVYGSYHSAKRYNSRILNEIHEAAKKLVISGF